MTREEKKEKRIKRNIRRRKRRMRKYVDRIQAAERSDIPLYAPLSLKERAEGGSMAVWDDPNSPTGRSQICSYVGTCQYPCNGDC